MAPELAAERRYMLALLIPRYLQREESSKAPLGVLAALPVSLDVAAGAMVTRHNRQAGGSGHRPDALSTIRRRSDDERGDCFSLEATDIVSHKGH
ncbi:MAG TPA: hypothetical protein VEK55_07500 [Xanthobacteraceae bacterium]|nr:hypothetical protein [Xanthobacteraceae bacterium]